MNRSPNRNLARWIYDKFHERRRNFAEENNENISMEKTVLNGLRPRLSVAGLLIRSS